MSWISQLGNQSGSLLRQLGGLRPYIHYFMPASGWIIGVPAAGAKWDGLSAACGLDQPELAKRSSMQTVIQKLDELLGELATHDLKEIVSLRATKTPNANVSLVRELCARLPNSSKILASRRKGKPPFKIEDEYDVQDLLHAILRCYIKETVQENPFPKLAGTNSSRADISIEKLGVIIEVKFARVTADQKKITRELSEDIVLYSSCGFLTDLIFVIYNSRELRDAEALEDFEKMNEIKGRRFKAHVVLC